VREIERSAQLDAGSLEGSALERSLARRQVQLEGPPRDGRVVLAVGERLTVVVGGQLGAEASRRRRRGSARA